MSKLETRLVGKNLPARDALKAAAATLKLLRSLDKEIHGKVTVAWQVNITSTFSDVIITFAAEGEPASEVAQKSMERKSPLT